MRWSPATLSHLAASAGFTHPDLSTATALALAASGGIDTYDHAVGLPGCGRYVGLWGIDVDRWPHLAPELHIPARSAEAAYALTVEHDGFGWSPCYRAGTDQRHHDLALVASSVGAFREDVPAPISSAALTHYENNLRARSAQLLVGVTRWPQTLR